MRSILFLIIFYLIKFTAFGQCNVQKREFNKTNNSYIYENEAEQISEAIMLKEGGLLVYINFIAIENPGDKSYFYGLRLEVGNIMTKSTFAPRVFIIKFTDNDQITLNAYSYDSMNEEFIWYLYGDINTTQINKLIYGEVKSCQFIDNRLEETADFKPYNGIFSTQLKCINKSLKL